MTDAIQPRSTHANSVEAFTATADARGQRREAVYRALLALPRTDRQVMQALGFIDGNAVKPRISELRDDGWVVEVESVQCPVTGRKVRVCRALTAEERSAHLRRMSGDVVDVMGEAEEVVV